MQLRAFDDRDGNDADVERVLQKFSEPPELESDFVIVKYGVVRAPDMGTPVAFLFPPGIQHSEAIAKIMEQERRSYDVFLEFQGAGTIVAGPNDDCDVRIGWGSTTCMQAFGHELMLDPSWANRHLAQLRDAIACRLRHMRLPLSVDVLWEKQREGPPAPVAVVSIMRSTAPCNGG